MPNLIYNKLETAITFKSSGGSAVITPTSVANGAGRISAQYDRGSGSIAQEYNVTAVFKAAAALATGTQLYLYAACSDGTSVAGNLGTADAALSNLPKMNNLIPIGAITADSTTNGELQILHTTVLIPTRYFSIVFWNALGQALSGTATDCFINLTPRPAEAQ